jgi:hypothetical protein
MPMIFDAMSTPFVKALVRLPFWHTDIRRRSGRAIPVPLFAAILAGETRVYILSGA